MLFLRGFLTGALAILTIYYTFRSAIPYPHWMMTPYEHPWILPLLAIAIAFVFTIDRAAGAMLILMVAAVALDVSVFGRRILRHENEDVIGVDEMRDVLSEPGVPLALDESENYALYAPSC